MTRPAADAAIKATLGYADVNGVVCGYLRDLAFTHTTAQLSHAETALAHARLAGIPADRIVNCWPMERLLAWLAEPSRERLS